MTRVGVRVLPFAASLVLLSGVWEGLARFGLINPIILPAPSAILDSLVFVADNFFGERGYSSHVAVTLAEILLGFGLGSGVAFVLGALVAEFNVVRQVLLPYMVILNAAPKIAFAPLFIVWLGFGIEPKVMMAAFICAFPVFINTVAGLRAVEQEQLELMASIRASKWQTFARLKLYQALPYVFASLKTAMVLAVIGAVVGEFSGAQEGLGYLVKLNASRLATADVYAFIIILSVLGWALFTAVEVLEGRVVFWASSQRSELRSL